MDKVPGSLTGKKAFCVGRIVHEIQLQSHNPRHIADSEF